MACPISKRLSPPSVFSDTLLVDVVSGCTDASGICRVMRTTTEETTIAAMARTLFVTAWADREEEEGRSLGRCELMHVAPSTEPEAGAAALRLVGRYEQANGMSLICIYAQACRADDIDQNDHENARLFGHYLAAQALGIGVSWFDDHARFPLQVPSFEFYLDPTEALAA